MWQNLVYIGHFVIGLLKKSKKCFFGHFKSQISKCPIYTKMLPQTLVTIELPSQRNKEIKKISSSERPFIKKNNGTILL